MFECDSVREQMPLLLTESMPPADRERAHTHIEQCALCSRHWSASRESWKALAELPELPVPARLRTAFMAEVETMQRGSDSNVVPFRPRLPLRRLAEAAVITALVGGSFLAGRGTTTKSLIAPQSTPVVAASSYESNPLVQPAAYRISENMVVPASSMNPDVEGRPDIQNVRFFNDPQASAEAIGVSFDVTSHVTVKGASTDRNMVKLMSYFLENRDETSGSRSSTVQWVRDQYTSKGGADPQIVTALANLLKNDAQEGVRIKAVDALKSLPPSATPEVRNALVGALKNDPNPAVRMKAVEALANLAKTQNALDPATLDTLRQKATQNDENAYVRVKAAEALSSVNL